MSDSLGEQLSIEQFLGDDEMEDMPLFPHGLAGESLVTFVQYMSSCSNSDRFVRLYGIFGEELLLFLSLFAGEEFKTPSFRTLMIARDQCILYSFLKARGFSEESYVLCSNIFNRKRQDLEKLVVKMSRALGKVEKAGEPDDG